MSVTESSGNVFADLGLPDPAGRLAKSKLASAISRAIDERGLTQTEAAARLGIAPAEITDIVRGKLAGIGYERLFGLLTALGYDVEIAVGASRSETPRVVANVAD